MTQWRERGQGERGSLRPMQAGLPCRIIESQRYGCSHRGVIKSFLRGPRWRGRWYWECRWPLGFTRGLLFGREGFIKTSMWAPERLMGAGRALMILEG